MYVSRGSLQVHKKIDDLTVEMCRGLAISADYVWGEFAKVCEHYIPQNVQLMATRDALQAQLDAYFKDHRIRGVPVDVNDEVRFLQRIGYLKPNQDAEKFDFKVETQKVDPEIADVAGPQLVVPIDNARFLLNAANARWGSLYDAVYGSNIIDETSGKQKSGPYNATRGAAVIAFANKFLDNALPLTSGSHSEVQEYVISAAAPFTFSAKTAAGVVTLKNPEDFRGFNRTAEGLRQILFIHHKLGIIVQIDKKSPIGQTDPRGVKDVTLESAISAIADMEDSVSAVDADDKANVYANWFQLMQGTLSAQFSKGGKTTTRTLAQDKTFTGVDGKPICLKGRAMMLVRNNSLHMSTDAVKFQDRPIPDGFLDCLMSTLAAAYDVRKAAKYVNSVPGSVYIVKPKMHGPDEVAFVCKLFGECERIAGLPPFTLKIGIMDEERRTSCNLPACIRAARKRAVFINTGFLDRTGDEIHSCFELGPVVPKGIMKQQKWISAYEDWNVDVGLVAGIVPGHGQIGKGMWAEPDNMINMWNTKLAHCQQGASCAWVPSPTAATIHVMHYHLVSVPIIQKTLAQGFRRAKLVDLLTPPIIAPGASLDPKVVEREVENSCQTILGYVVRWIELGVGCSKVPDINNIGLMEDRATLRISSQQLANWLHHGVITEAMVIEKLKKMAVLVDKQNASDPKYIAMAPKFENSAAFQSATALILRGRIISNGLTEYTLYPWRRYAKERQIKGQLNTPAKL